MRLVGDFHPCDSYIRTHPQFRIVGGWYHLHPALHTERVPIHEDFFGSAAVGTAKVHSVHLKASPALLRKTISHKGKDTCYARLHIESKTRLRPTPFGNALQDVAHPPSCPDRNRLSTIKLSVIPI